MGISWIFVLSIANMMFCPNFVCAPVIHPGICNTLLQDATGTLTFSLQDTCLHQIQYCNFSYQPNVDDHCVIVDNLLPGERCIVDTQCKSGKCDLCHNKCIGASPGGVCAIHDDCNIGLYCGSDSTCKNWNLLNQLCGGTDGECASYLICHQNKCIVPGTVAIGQAAFNPFACSTLFTMETTPGNFICASGPILTNSQACPVNGKCGYSIGTAPNVINVSESCQCGYTPNGSSFCPKGLGDLGKKIKNVNM